MLGGEDVVLGVNNVEAQRTKLLHLHRLPPVLSGLQVVPAREIEKGKKNTNWFTGIGVSSRRWVYSLLFVFPVQTQHDRRATCAASVTRLAADVYLNN